MITRCHHKGVEVRQAWGMTETSALGLSAALKPKHRLLPAEDRLALECKQGGPVFGMEFRVVGGEGRAVTHDGRSCGSMLVRGLWVGGAYLKAATGCAQEQVSG